MPAKKLQRSQKKDSYSHIYNSGVDGRNIFNDNEDYLVFLNYLKEYLSPPKDKESAKRVFTIKGRSYKGTPHQPKNYFNKVELIGYGLSSAKFELLLHQMAPNSLSFFIRSLCTRYSMYFNKKYKRSGSLFRGPYKSNQVDSPKDLLSVSKRLHANPRYSSYPEFIGNRQSSWVKAQVVLDLLDSRQSYKEFMGNNSEPLERSSASEVLSSSPASEAKVTSSLTSISSSPFHLIPEFTAAFGMLVVLAALGIRNIKASESQAPPEIAQMPLVQEIQVLPAATQEPDPVDLGQIPGLPVGNVITDGSAAVNIRQNPNIESKIVGKAHDGDLFEIVSMSDDWYEVKLEQESTGFISKNLMISEQTQN